MLVSFAGTLLVDPSSRMFGRTEISGANVVDVAELAQAAAPAIFDRGNLTNTIKITQNDVGAYDTFEAAQFDFLTITSGFPKSGILTFTTGEAGESNRTVTFGNCVVQSIQPVMNGVNLSLVYTFICGEATAGDPPSIVTVSPLNVQKIDVPISNGATSVVVVFDTPFASGHVPVVNADVDIPTTGGVQIFGRVIKDTVSETGFTYELAGTIPTTGYRLQGLAAY